MKKIRNDKKMGVPAAVDRSLRGALVAVAIGILVGFVHAVAGGSADPGRSSHGQ